MDNVSELLHQIAQLEEGESQRLTRTLLPDVQDMIVDAAFRKFHTAPRNDGHHETFRQAWRPIARLRRVSPHLRDTVNRKLRQSILTHQPLWQGVLDWWKVDRDPDLEGYIFFLESILQAHNNQFPFTLLYLGDVYKRPHQGVGKLIRFFMDHGDVFRPPRGSPRYRSMKEVHRLLLARYCDSVGSTKELILEYVTWLAPEYGGILIIAFLNADEERYRFLKRSWPSTTMHHQPHGPRITTVTLTNLTDYLADVFVNKSDFDYFGSDVFCQPYFDIDPATLVQRITFYLPEEQLMPANFVLAYLFINFVSQFDDVCLYYGRMFAVFDQKVQRAVREEYDAMMPPLPSPAQEQERRRILFNTP